ncbi:MAG: hypothetical protein AB7T06_39525 [Kofleriaceae bacterium]
MKKTALCVAVALLVGCANLPPNRPLVDPERRAVAAALLAWSEAERPAIDDSIVDPQRAIIAVVPRERMLDECLACWPHPPCRDIAACSFAPNTTVFDSPRMMIVATDDLTEAQLLFVVVHETLHVYRADVVRALLERGAALPEWARLGDLPDRQHLDSELWTEIQAAAVADLR